ncbi:hypothetical protein [Enterovibrio nigricans]|uniref:Uncharacterized protein n=1 Tax=Enterovibrio nigricans DSM 22720 TaxID=1121868 RepID=A0A1T4VDL8_9GAMM|nr:hypothetical protein [Enterovibrio nigricans]PKF49945.1 hypothetical protein AT251_15145 [Enterovibrio nigricans]SKA62651.1 hypothetical protein SAMN02745132_03652 [Enterovibrio nigricans DSM 22720]
MSSVFNIKKRYLPSLFFFSLYFLNVIGTKIQIASGDPALFRISDVGEFLLLLLTALTFVVAMLFAEKDANSHSTE